MFKFCTLLLLSIIAVSSPPAVADEEVTQKAVLITGASSGLGRHATEQLAKAGYFVYAGARKDKDLDSLNKITNVKAIRLDVTKADDISAAVRLIEDEGRGLWGLVNNAGINIIDPLIEARESDLKFLFDVNVYGVFRITKAFAPLIIESKGRIVNMSSIAGTLSGGIPAYGMYVMSKHAVEAFTDQLSFEMKPLGVTVSAIEPGNFKSRIGVSRCRRMIAQSSTRKYVYFSEVMGQYLASCKELEDDKSEDSGLPPVKVSNAIEHALFAEHPKEHYLVVPVKFEAMITLRKSIEELLALNHEHEFSYTREQLIDLIDKEWAILRGEAVRKWQPDSN